MASSDMPGSVPFNGASIADNAQSGVKYQTVDAAYFEQRGLTRYAGVASLWALGVGAVISGEFSGWNLGFATGGWGGMIVATLIISAMYLGLTFSIAEMSAAQPHTGAAYSFARTAMGPWGGFITGLCENVEYVITPAVVVTFVVAAINDLAGIPVGYSPLLWVICYAIFLGLNIFGLELSYKVTMAVCLLSIAVLVVFILAALPHIDFGRWALNIDAGPDGAPVEVADGHGPMFPFGFSGILATLPFAVWLFLAIEQLPLAAEEAVDPQRDLPKAIVLGMFTLIALALLIVWLNPAIVGIGSFKLGTSLTPVIDGFGAIFSPGLTKFLGALSVVGLISSVHAILYAQGRQIYSLSRAGYFPRGLSLTHGTHKTPYVAMLVGSAVGLIVMLAIWFTYGADAGSSLIGSVLLNMAVCGAMFSYVSQGISYILLRKNHPDLKRPYKSPMGYAGAVLTIVIALVTLAYQIKDPLFFKGVVWVFVWFAVGIAYFALVGRHKLVLSPEEEFALSKGQTEYKTH